MAGSTNFPSSLDSHTGASPLGIGEVNNQAYTKATASHTNSVTTITVASTSKFPSKGYILPQEFLVETVVVTDEAVIGWDAERSDANVANYFQVNMPRFDLFGADMLNLAGVSKDPRSFYLQDYPNATPKLYGMRFMEAATQMGGADSLGRVDGQSEAVMRKGVRSDALWIDQRRAQLMAQNKDNVVFESGSITLSGSNQQSSAFNADTWLLRVTATVNAWIAIAANPDATTTPRIYMPAGTTEYFVVSPSHKISGVTA